MSSYLVIAFLGGGSLLEVESSQDGILAEAPFYRYLCLLNAVLLVEFGFSFLLLLFFLFIVAEEVELLRPFVLGRLFLGFEVIYCDVQSADEQDWVNVLVKQRCDGISDNLCRRGRKWQAGAAVCMLWHHLAVVVLLYVAVIFGEYVLVLQVFCVISHVHRYLVSDELVGNQFQCHAVSHLLYYHACFLEGIRLCQHLSAAERTSFRPVCLYHVHSARLPTPGVVYEQFSVYSEEAVKQFFVLFRHACHLAHSVYAIYFQRPCDAASYAPEVRNGSMVPQLPAIGHLVQLCYAHPVLVGLRLLGHDVHSHLCQIHIRTYAGCCRNARL